MLMMMTSENTCNPIFKMVEAHGGWMLIIPRIWNRWHVCAVREVFYKLVSWCLTDAMRSWSQHQKCERGFSGDSFLLNWEY